MVFPFIYLDNTILLRMILNHEFFPFVVHSRYHGIVFPFICKQPFTVFLKEEIFFTLLIKQWQRALTFALRLYQIHQSQHFSLKILFQGMYVQSIFLTTKVCLEPSQTNKMELKAPKFRKSSVLNAWLGSKYTFGLSLRNEWKNIDLLSPHLVVGWSYCCSHNTEEKQFLETIPLQNVNFKIYIFNYFVLSLQVIHSLTLLFY